MGGLAECGRWVPSEWSADVNAMRFAQKVKMLNTYKGNNTDTMWLLLQDRLSTYRVEEKRWQTKLFLNEVQEILFWKNEKHCLINLMLSLNNQALLSKSFILTPQLEMSSSIFDNDMWEEKAISLLTEKH